MRAGARLEKKPSVISACRRVQPAPRSFLNALGEGVAHDGTSGVDWRIAVYVIVTKDGRLLLLEPHPGEKWQLPGGAAQPHESLAEAAARECREETGYRFSGNGAVYLV